MALDPGITDIDWDRLLTSAQWASTLSTLLTAAAKVASAEDGDDLSDLQDVLRTYVKMSPPKVQNLDAIASATIEDLMSVEINARVAAIASRNAELQKQIAIIAGATSDAKADAAQLRLEPVIQQLTQARQALEKLQQDYAAAGESASAWYKKAQSAIAGLNTFLS